jgi:RimJ/RimL family protein N-acetyltransferase
MTSLGHMGWQVRPVEPRDGPQVNALFAKHLAELGLTPNPELDADMTEFPGVYLAPNGYFCVADDGLEHVIGMGGISAGVIRRVHVVQSARGMGLGKRLVSHLCYWARSLGLTRVEAVIAYDNLASQRLFSACGFRQAAGPTWARSLDSEGQPNLC